MNHTLKIEVFDTTDRPQKERLSELLGKVSILVVSIHTAATAAGEDLIPYHYVTVVYRDIERL
jgi:hypothetical protein